MAIEGLYKLFRNPSREFRGKPLWAWSSKPKKDELLSQIQISKKMGFGGFVMHSRGGLETSTMNKVSLSC